MNAAATSASRSTCRICLSSRHLFRQTVPSRCSSTATYKPPVNYTTPPPKTRYPELDRVPERPKKKRPSTIPETIAPQLSQAEISSAFSQELFVFRCDVTATQIQAAMRSYEQLRDVGILTANDISNLARQIHAKFRVESEKSAVLEHVKTMVKDLEEKKIAAHPLASVHLLSCLKDMEEFEISNKFWAFLKEEDMNYCDARTYGAAIECLAYQGTHIDDLEALWTEALERYATTTLLSVARDTGRGTPVMLLQGIITARLFAGRWREAYEAFDICVRLYPTLTPARIYELFIYERPVREAYIVFLMACRAGTPPKPAVLTPLLKEVWTRTREVTAMLRLVYNFVGAGGQPAPMHLNSLIAGILGSLPPGADTAEALKHVRALISAFRGMGVRLSLQTFNTIITLGGKLLNTELVHEGLRELLQAGLTPNMVTYRILVNAVGDLQDENLLQKSWENLKAGSSSLRTPLDIADLRALARAAVAVGNEAYARAEIEALKLDVGHTVYRSALRDLAIAREQKGKALGREMRGRSLELRKEDLKNEMKTLAEVFGAREIVDFNGRGWTNESMFSIDSAPVDGAPDDAVLRDIYHQLAGRIDVAAAEGEDGDAGTGTGTGFSVQELRFENWKAVNRLLFEAEVHEVKEQRRKEMAVLGGMRPDNERGGLGWEYLFWNEEVAKKRVQDIVNKRKIGGVMWKDEEMEVRGTLVRAKREPVRQKSTVVVDM